PSSFYYITRPPPPSTLFPYTTLFRSVDRRDHLAGNCFDSRHRNGVLVHNYGPHYFRTNDADLLAYLSRFTDWVPAREARQIGERSEEHTSELQSRGHLVCRLLLEKKK